MLGTSLILAILVFGPEAPPCRFAKKLLHADGVGLIIFAGVGGLCLIGGGEFLNYSHFQIPGVSDEVHRRYLGIVMTQIGVAIDIAVTAMGVSCSDVSRRLAVTMISSRTARFSCATVVAGESRRAAGTRASDNTLVGRYGITSPCF